MTAFTSFSRLLTRQRSSSGGSGWQQVRLPECPVEFRPGMASERELTLIELEADARRRFERKSEPLLDWRDLERGQVVRCFIRPEIVVVAPVSRRVLTLLPGGDDAIERLRA